MKKSKGQKKRKTIKAIAKRFWRTGSGKIMRRRAGMRHLLSTKSRGEKGRLKGDVMVSPTDLKRLLAVIP